MGGITLSEWKNPPGPPFSPKICLFPNFRGISKSCFHKSNLGAISIELIITIHEIFTL